ncbi:MAG: N-acetylneuraminate synthase family protein [Pirellulales bacterium]|jgi:sialic acid synthase SpsE|nr:N-acetylneuraminate synthase family protein [Pirellulales bacterium]
MSAQNGRTKIIAEACANHLGESKLQEEMIWAAAEAGADYIKFQSWTAASNTRGQSDAMLPFELSDDDHFRLREVAQRARIGFSTTVFDRQRTPFVAKLGLDFIKIASPDCGSSGLLSDVAARFPLVILSTGMSEEAEVRGAAQVVRSGGARLALLHCMYPLVDGAYHLRRMEWLREHASEVGLSDHSAGDDLRASKLAIALGADWIERHFILSRSQPAKDAAVSIDPAGLKELVEAAKDPRPHLALADEFPELLGDEQPELSGKVTGLREFYCGRWGDNR